MIQRKKTKFDCKLTVMSPHTCFAHSLTLQLPNILASHAFKLNLPPCTRRALRMPLASFLFGSSFYN